MDRQRREPPIPMVPLNTAEWQASILDPRRDQWSLIRWDIEAGREISRWNIPLGFLPVIGPAEEGREVLLVHIGSYGWLAKEAKRRGRVPGLDFDSLNDPWECIIFHTLAEREVARLTPHEPDWVQLSPDGRTLVVVNRSWELEFWDVPPRKSLTWGVIALGTWTVLVAWLTRRRMRKLPPDVAEATLDPDIVLVS